MHYSIDGTVAHSVKLEPTAAETAWASKGTIIAHTDGIEWDVRMPGGVTSAFKRALSGEGVALAHIRSVSAGQSIILGANAVGHLMEWSLAAQGPVYTTRGAFLAAWGDGIEISVAVAKRAGAAFFGGAGLVLQRVEGDGTVLIHGSGDFRQIELAPGEELRVSTGHLAAFSDSVDYSIESVGSVRKTLFGKEGFFMARLRGPGTVLLRSLKPAKQANIPT
jgi:uncharacterized protein (AIM24 family)